MQFLSAVWTLTAVDPLGNQVMQNFFRSPLKKKLTHLMMLITVLSLTINSIKMHSCITVLAKLSETDLNDTVPL